VQLERRLIARLKTANIRFADAQVERIWAIVSAHQKAACWNESQPTRMASDWCRMTPHADKESNNHDPRARHRHELAEPPLKPKKLSHPEHWTALRAALGLPPQ